MSVTAIILLLLTTSLAMPTLVPPAAAAPTGPVEITLEKVSPEYLGEDDELTFTGKIINNTEDLLSPVTVWWRMRTPVLSDETLTDWINGDDDVTPLTLARHDLPSEIGPGRTQEYEMVIPVDNSPFDYGSDIGPRGIELVVTATDEEGERVRDAVRSTIIWYPDGSALPTPVSVAVPLTPTEPEWVEALSQRIPVAEASGERITAVVDGLDDHEVTWGVDASIVDSVPAFQLAEFLPPGDVDIGGEEGSESPEPPEPLDWPSSSSAGKIGDALAHQAGTRPVISLGWAAPDYKALTNAGSDGEFLRQRNADYARELLHEAGLRVDDAAIWSFTPLTPGSISRFNGTIDTVIIPPTGAGAEFAPPTSQHLTLRSPDQELVDLLLGATSSNELRARSLIYAEEKSQLLVTMPPGITAEEADRLGENLRVLRSAPWVRLSAPVPPAPSDLSPRSVSQPGSTIPSTELTRLAQSLSHIDSLAQVTDDADHFTAMFDTAAFLSFSHVWNTETSTQKELFDDVRRGADMDYLSIEQPSTVNLISQGGELPIGVENSSPIALHPTVVVQPEDARLLAEEPVESTLESGQSSTVRVPITAVANGNVKATIRLLNSDGTDVAAPQNFIVRVRADWETTGTAIFAGVVAVGFLFGLIRNIRSAPGRHGRRQHG